MFFPLKFPSLEFKIRHSGDPLMMALNITPERGSLNFGMKAGQQLTAGILGLCVSVIIMGVICWKCRETCCDLTDIFMIDSEEVRYRKQINDYRKSQKSKGRRYEVHDEDEDEENKSPESKRFRNPNLWNDGGPEDKEGDFDGFEQVATETYRTGRSRGVIMQPEDDLEEDDEFEARNG